MCGEICTLHDELLKTVISSHILPEYTPPLWLDWQNFDDEHWTLNFVNIVLQLVVFNVVLQKFREI